MCCYSLFSPTAWNNGELKSSILANVKQKQMQNQSNVCLVRSHAVRRNRIDRWTITMVARHDRHDWTLADSSIRAKVQRKAANIERNANPICLIAPITSISVSLCIVADQPIALLCMHHTHTAYSATFPLVRPMLQLLFDGSVDVFVGFVAK